MGRGVAPCRAPGCRSSPRRGRTRRTCPTPARERSRHRAAARETHRVHARRVDACVRHQVHDERDCELEVRFSEEPPLPGRRIDAVGRCDDEPFGVGDCVEAAVRSLLSHVRSAPWKSTTRAVSSPDSFGVGSGGRCTRNCRSSPATAKACVVVPGSYPTPGVHGSTATVVVLAVVVLVDAGSGTDDPGSSLLHAAIASVAETTTRRETRGTTTRSLTCVSVQQNGPRRMRRARTKAATEAGRRELGEHRRLRLSRRGEAVRPDPDTYASRAARPDAPVNVETVAHDRARVPGVRREPRRAFPAAAAPKAGCCASSNGGGGTGPAGCCKCSSATARCRGNDLAASVTLITFLSLFPLALVAIAVLGFLQADSSDFASDLIDNLGLTGEAAEEMETALDKAAKSRTRRRSSACSACCGPDSASPAALRLAYNSVWQVQDRGLKDKAVALGWVAGAAALFTGGAAVTALTRWLPVSRNRSRSWLRSA